MNDNVEYLVREGLDRLTEGERAPHGLALRAAVNRRRRRATRAGLASVTAAVAAVAVVAATGASGTPGTTAAVQTDAYVVSHVSSALSPASLANQIEELSVPYQVDQVPGEIHEPGEPTIIINGGQPFTVDRAVGWSYDGKAKEDLYNAADQFSAELWLPRGLYVLPGSKTWTTVPLNPSAGLPTPIDGCRTVSGGVPTLYFASPSYIRATLACGGFRIAGYPRIGGQRTVELVRTARSVGMWLTTLYVSPQTYRPVRVVTMGVTADFRWLPATAANVAMLNPVVPAGFLKVPAYPADILDPNPSSQPDLRLMPIGGPFVSVAGNSTPPK
jgi:hypothetical protein